MARISVLKFGSSVLRSRADLPLAIHEIYLHWRAGRRVIAVVSAFAGETDRLLREGEARGLHDHALAELVASGERESAQALTQALLQAGVSARSADPAAIRLRATGAALEATPCDLDLEAVRAALADAAVLVVPGYFALDQLGRTVLLGRGGSDLSALYIAQRLGADCRLVKDVDGVYDHDPADRSSSAHRYQQLSWRRALEVGGELVQPRAILFAQARGFDFDVATSCARTGTRIGAGPDVFSPPRARTTPLRIVLLGLGTVGTGVYFHLARHPHLFDVRRIVVRDPMKARDVELPTGLLTSDLAVALAEPADVLVETFGGLDPAAAILRSALARDLFVVTANKAVVAAHWPEFARFASGPCARLRFSAAAGGALPVLETVSTLRPGVRRVRAVINGTCNYILDALAQGIPFEAALAAARDAGFAESDPSNDLSGVDAAHKLQLISHAAFGEHASIAVEVEGIERVTMKLVRDAEGRGRRLRLVAECERRPGEASGVRADHVAGHVRMEELPASHFLAGARAEENRVEIYTGAGVVRLAGKGAGRWPTAESVMGDLFGIAGEHFEAITGGRAADDAPVDAGVAGSGYNRM